MSAEIKSLVLDTWAGRRYYAVELVGETPKKSRIRVLTPGGVMLPGCRYVNCGETVLVPKHAAICPSLVLEIDRPNGPPRKDLGSREARKAFDMLVLRLGNPAVRSRDSRC